jgi:hypothetical protein
MLLTAFVRFTTADRKVQRQLARAGYYHMIQLPNCRTIRHNSRMTPLYRTLVKRLSTFSMKRNPAIIPIVALAIGMIARSSLDAEDRESAEARNARYDQIQEQISDSMQLNLRGRALPTSSWGNIVSPHGR